MKYRKKPVVVEEAEINSFDAECRRCKYYKHLKGWPGTYMACHYAKETGQELDGDDWCSGFTEVEEGEEG